MKKFYGYSFLAGCGSAFIVILAPYVIGPVGDAFGNAFSRLFGASGTSGLFLDFVAFFIMTLPLFVIYLFLPVGRGGLRAARNKVLAVLIFLIYFTLGVLAVYFLWLLLTFFALSGSALVR